MNDLEILRLSLPPMKNVIQSEESVKACGSEGSRGGNAKHSKCVRNNFGCSSVYQEALSVNKFMLTGVDLYAPTDRPVVAN
jgi:hypothetical protein